MHYLFALLALFATVSASSANARSITIEVEVELTRYLLKDFYLEYDPNLIPTGFPCETFNYSQNSWYSHFIEVSGYVGKMQSEDLDYFGGFISTAKGQVTFVENDFLAGGYEILSASGILSPYGSRADVVFYEHDAKTGDLRFGYGFHNAVSVSLNETTLRVGVDSDLWFGTLPFGTWRSDEGYQADYDVTYLKVITPVPLRAGGVLLLGAITGLGLYRTKRRQRSTNTQ